MMYEREIDDLMAKAADAATDSTDEKWESIERFLNLLEISGYVIARKTDLRPGRNGMCGGF